MRIAVAAWAPEYSAGVDLREPEDVSVEATKNDWERWEPVPRSSVPDEIEDVAFVDGTRRIDARVFRVDDEAPPAPGIAGSIAVGAMVCSARARGPRPEVGAERISRYLALCGERATGLFAAPGLDYAPMAVRGDSLDAVVDALQDHMRRLEADLAVEAARDGRIVFADGPLAKIEAGGRRIVGCIKSHEKRYLGPEESKILPLLGCGERSPIFSFGERRHRFSWYVRLCERDRNSHGWHGLVRCEVPFSIGIDRAREVADASTALLPRFASKPHWDKRAPQNLVPIACLERRLRHRMSDPQLVHRKIAAAAARAGREGDAGD